VCHCAALHKACEAEARFISVCSHELRTPLNAILSYSAFLAEDMEQPTDKDGRHSTTSPSRRHSDDLLCLQAAAQSLHQIVENVLAFSTNPSQVRLEGLHTLRPVVDNIFAMARHQGAQRGDDACSCPDFVLDWTNPPGGTGLFLPMDRFRLVVLNLVMNARKFSAAGSRITVACSVVHDSARGANFLETSVSDEGPGVAETDARRVFTPFVRLANSTGVEGVGLGLSICQASVERSGGEIHLDDTYKDGARFVFTLPLADTAGRESTGSLASAVHVNALSGASGAHRVAASLPLSLAGPSTPQPGATQRAGPLRCLIVDDVAVNRRLLRRHLERSSIPVVVEEVDGPIDVLTNPSITSYHLILLDVYMPIMSGMEVASIFRSRHGEALGYIVASSASKFDMVDLRKSGFDTCIPKPIDRSRLQQVLEEVRDRRTHCTFQSNWHKNHTHKKAKKKKQ